MEIACAYRPYADTPDAADRRLRRRWRSFTEPPLGPELPTVAQHLAALRGAVILAHRALLRPAPDGTAHHRQEQHDYVQACRREHTAVIAALRHGTLGRDWVAADWLERWP